MSNGYEEEEIRVPVSPSNFAKEGITHLTDKYLGNSSY